MACPLSGPYYMASQVDCQYKEAETIEESETKSAEIRVVEEKLFQDPVV